MPVESSNPERVAAIPAGPTPRNEVCTGFIPRKYKFLDDLPMHQVFFDDPTRIVESPTATAKEPPSGAGSRDETRKETTRQSNATPIEAP